MPRFKTLGWIDQCGVIGGEFACAGIELELVHRIRACVWHEGKSIRSINKYCMCASMSFQLADCTLHHRTIFPNAMAADQSSTVTGPKQCLPSAIGGNIGRVGADVGGGDMLEVAIGVIDVEGGDSVAAADGNIDSVPVGAYELAAGCSG